MSKGEADLTNTILEAAAGVAQKVSANVLFTSIDSVPDPVKVRESLGADTRLVLVCRDAEGEDRAAQADCEHITVPAFDLTRMGQIKMATILAFSQQVLKPGDVFVFVTGVSRRKLDTMVTMRVGEEYELFQSVGQPKLTEHIRRAVFEKVLTLLLELAHEGREGKPVGALFSVGDYREVQKYCVEGRINPFRGYTEKERNILDDSIRDTVKELAKLDGAFVLKGNGVIMSAGTMLQPAVSVEKPSLGLGARHAAAAAISASTKCLALSLSESTGAVRIWRRGQMITEIERSSLSPLEGRPEAER